MVIKSVECSSKLQHNTANTHEERSIILRCQARLPQAQISIAIGDAKLIAVLRKTTARHFGKCPGRPRSANHLLVAPFPHLHRTILAAGQIQRHQRMRAHALDVVDLVFQHLYSADQKPISNVTD